MKPTSELTAHELSADGNDYLDALDAATRAGLTVGVAAGDVDVQMPRQENFFAGLDVSIEESAPSLLETADHVVEFDLSSSGRIRLEGSGGSGEVAVAVPPGDYRARLSGFDFDAAASWSYDDTGYPADHYRLELWPAAEPMPPAELRRWPGYEDRLYRISGHPRTLAHSSLWSLGHGADSHYERSRPMTALVRPQTPGSLSRR